MQGDKDERHTKRLTEFSCAPMWQPPSLVWRRSNTLGVATPNKMSRSTGVASSCIGEMLARSSYLKLVTAETPRRDEPPAVTAKS